MACSECKKKKDEQDKFIQQTDRITKMVLLGILVGGTLAIYGLVTLIGNISYIYIVIERNKKSSTNRLRGLLF